MSPEWQALLGAVRGACAASWCRSSASGPRVGSSRGLQRDSDQVAPRIMEDGEQIWAGWVLARRGSPASEGGER